MSGNNGRFAAGGAVLAAVAAFGAHSAGLFKAAGDDAVRIGRQGDEVFPPPPRDPPNVPAPTVADDLVRQGEDDQVAFDVICFAYENFYDASTGAFTAPSAEEFVENVVQALAPSGSQAAYRFEAESLYEELAEPDVDLADVAQELAC
jgi:hypothetical protein